MRHLIPLGVPFAAALALGACTGDPAAPALTARIVSVVPSGGATNVDPAAPIVATFDHAMAPGMEAYASLHRGDATGPVVTGTWAWSQDRTTLTFAPDQPLESNTQYTLRLGGGMRAMDDGYVDYGPCAAGHGGEWTGGGMMGGNMGGMMRPGMTFTFTTA